MQRVKDQQNSRSTKPATIHASAQSGDLSGVQRRLRDQPSLINDRNPVMANTPLHVAAGHNSVEVVKFLLNISGPETVELEAKNMYGETPLHIAAKNGCNEAAGLLLSHGAFTEAKANNGMTPLHLSVWHSLRAEDSSTVLTLLEHNADCSAKDNTLADDKLVRFGKVADKLDNKEGMTPLNHLSQGSGNEKLQALLKSYLEQQRKVRAIEACSETKAKMDELEKELSNLVGLHELKLQLRKWAKGMLLDERRRALGLKVGTRRPPHMAFLGNPGTGKTMVARILGKLLFMVGILPTDKVTEVQRTDLVGEFVGHTGPRLGEWYAPLLPNYALLFSFVKEAEGGILFVDEAYRLIPMQKSDDKDYGLEALEEIMSVMDNGKVVVIFAGYSEPMKRVISSNEGFCRRVTKFFTFDDFTPEDLADILRLKMSNQTEGSLLYGFKLHPLCTVKAMATLIETETTEKQRKEMNGGMVDPLLVNARENLDLRLSFDCMDTDELLTITLEDLQGGIRLLSQ
ncbi:hypothetical protein OSB04_015191 [Centaurea solstitialis]|uniref:AAA+ ATPase domain-containing protein n=1 Tax=Centaurea solstitialis TaxID=347529 RepID=A0AA38TBX5_9ASTR|nr:hypothetical protein OSB04_015191 [Centaurea solstitialis]